MPKSDCSRPPPQNVQTEQRLARRRLGNLRHDDAPQVADHIGVRVDLLQRYAAVYRLADELVVVGNAADEKLAERSAEHTSELQSRENIVCRPLLENKQLPNS